MKSSVGSKKQGRVLDKVKISIVVPVFNVEQDLAYCLDCLIGQTLKEIEIICVEDASTDNSKNILNDYAKRDNRIKIIQHVENLSASISRKDGAIAASGEYTLFVDPDDSLERNALERLYLTAKEKQVEIVHFGTNVINKGVTDSQVEWYKKFSKPYSGFIYGEEVFTKCFETQEYRFNIWNKLILTSLCKKAMAVHTDVPLPKAQDLYAYFLIAYYARSYYGMEDKFYNYSFGSGVSGGRNFTEEKFRRHCTQANVALFIIDFLIKQNCLKKYYKATYKIINNLINDNLASIKACGKARAPFSAERIFCDYWLFGEYNHILVEYIQKEKDQICAKLLFEIDFKIFKNVSIKTRKLVLNNLLKIGDDFPDIIRDLTESAGVQSKDYMFLRAINATKRAKAYGDRYIPVFMATNNNYAAFLGVTLNSLIKNSDSYYFYDIYILHSGINEYYINKLDSVTGGNISVCCLNVKEIITSQSLYSNRHYSVEMYHRFLIPELFFFLEKVIYIDCDTIVLDSIHRLYNIDIGNNVLGAARNLLHTEMYRYVLNKLNADPKKYINSGVLIINCEQFISQGIKNKCYAFLKEHGDLVCPDQDALNLCCKDIAVIDNSWNFQWHHALNKGISKYALVNGDAEIFATASEHIKLLHFTSDRKPWNYSMSNYSEVFWNYAKTSLFSLEVEHRYRDLQDPINNKIKDLYVKIGKLTKQIEELKRKKNSKFLKVMAWPFNMLVKTFKCIKNKGIHYTIIRIFAGRKKALSYEEKKNRG